MGSRSLLIVVYRGEAVIGKYSQWRASPWDSQGASLDVYFENYFDKVSLERGLSRSVPAPNCDVLTGIGDDSEHPLSRNVPHGEYLVYLQEHPCPMRYRPCVEFILSSDCEWVYVIDLDSDSFQVYSSGGDSIPDIVFRTRLNRHSWVDFLDDKAYVPKSEDK